MSIAIALRTDVAVGYKRLGLGKGHPCNPCHRLGKSPKWPMGQSAVVQAAVDGLRLRCRGVGCLLLEGMPHGGASYG